MNAARNLTATGLTRALSKLTATPAFAVKIDARVEQLAQDTEAALIASGSDHRPEPARNADGPALRVHRADLSEIEETLR